MKVYLIWNVTRQLYMCSNDYPNGFYASETSANKAVGQFKTKRKYKNDYFLIKEFELVNEKVIGHNNT